MKVVKHCRRVKLIYLKTAGFNIVLKAMKKGEDLKSRVVCRYDVQVQDQENSVYRSLLTSKEWKTRNYGFGL